jgi:hypothetical protein
MNNKDENKLDILKKLNKTIRTQIFSHHPNCELYNQHVFTFGEWRFCVGCTALYSTIVLLAIIDFIFRFSINFTPAELFIIGIILFIPALIQLKWKSSKKLIKFLSRVSLGISTYFLLIWIFFAINFFFKTMNGLIFLTVLIIYSKQQGKKQLKECYPCKIGI